MSFFVLLPLSSFLPKTQPRLSFSSQKHKYSNTLFIFSLNLLSSKKTSLLVYQSPISSHVFRPRTPSLLFPFKNNLSFPSLQTKYSNKHAVRFARLYLLPLSSFLPKTTSTFLPRAKHSNTHVFKFACLCTHCLWCRRAHLSSGMGGLAAVHLMLRLGEAGETGKRRGEAVGEVGVTGRERGAWGAWNLPVPSFFPGEYSSSSSSVSKMVPR